MQKCFLDLSKIPPKWRWVEICTVWKRTFGVKWFLQIRHPSNQPINRAKALKETEWLLQSKCHVACCLLHGDGAFSGDQSFTSNSQHATERRHWTWQCGGLQQRSNCTGLYTHSHTHMHTDIQHQTSPSTHIIKVNCAILHWSIDRVLFIGLEPVDDQTTEVRNEWPVQCKTYGYLPGCTASLPID